MSTVETIAKRRCNGVFLQAEDGIRDWSVTGVQTCALPILTFATDASAEVVCSGHKLLPIPRAQSSCSNVKPRIYPSPDRSEERRVGKESKGQRQRHPSRRNRQR